MWRWTRASPRRPAAGNGLALAGGPAQGRPERSVATENYGIPLGIASAGANRHDSPLLAPTLQAAHRQLGGVLPEERTCHLTPATTAALPARP